MFKIPRDAKILSISHYDLDGCGCQIVLANAFDNVTFINSSFYNIDEKIETLNYDKYDYVIITDIHPENKNLLYLSDKIILIDHHPSDMHDAKNNLHVIQKGVCATTLTKHYVEKMTGEKLSHLDEFVRLVNDYDMWHLTDPRSKQLNDLMFHKYHAMKFRQQFMDGRVEFTDLEKEYLVDYDKQFEETYENLDVFDFDSINACIVSSFHFVNEISHRLLTEEKYNMVVVRNPKTERASVRISLEGLDIGAVLEELGYGGGHAEAAGMFCESLQDLQTRVGNLEQKLYDDYESIRKVTK